MAWYKHSPTNIGWLWRGAQSAIFFYVSCAPCVMHSAAKKQEKANKRAMAEREEQMRLAEGMFYTQPLPRQTNEAWRSEIDLGVGRPSEASERKGDSPRAPPEGKASRVSRESSESERNRKQIGSRGSGNTRGKDARSKETVGSKARKKVNSKGSATQQNALIPRSMSEADGQIAPRSVDGNQAQGDADHPSAPPERVNTAGPSSSNGGASLTTTLVTDGGANSLGDSAISIGGSQGKKRRFQRPMEPLWGLTQGYGPPSRLEGLEDPKPEPEWYVKRNPEVNDLHPPVVGSLPKNKKEALWMIQPPPPAAFMEGRSTDLGIRSRSSTATTRSTSQGTNVSNGSLAKRGRKRSPRRRVNGTPERQEEHSGGSKEIPRRKKRPAPLKTIKSEGL